jgi:type II secretory ATPase GspE/PulE/Tfp pilus assembly ATPase PilB-like protein
MVGDLHEPQTAGLVVRSALTGRLALAAMHTPDTASTVTRLLDYGIEPYFLCGTLSGIVAQRLVRKLCTTCREPSKMEASSLVPLGIDVPKESASAPLWRAKGCAKCGNTGYTGLTGFFEVLAVDHHIRSLIIKRSPGAQIRQSAVSKGMVTLSQAGWHNVQSGDTTLEELLRVLPPEIR